MTNDMSNDMTDDDRVRSIVLTIADDGLDVERTLQVLGNLRRQRQRRRQAVSLLSAAAIVIVVVLLIGTSFGGLAAPRPVQPGPAPTAVTSSPSPSAPTTPLKTTPAKSTPAKTTPAKSTPAKTTPTVRTASPVTLVAYARQQVNSPVSTTATAENTSPEWVLEPGRLWVAWRSFASRQIQTPTAEPDESRGYVISGASVAVPLTNRETHGPVEGRASAATVNGHAAVLTTAPVETVDAQGYPAQSRLSWTLPDGRTIHVFDTDPDATTKTLQQFADSIRDVPMPLGPGFTVGVAPRGCRLQYADAGSFAASFSLCPVADPAAAITRCLTVSSGTDTQTGNGSGAQIQAEGDQHAVSNGTLYLQLAKNRAILFGGTLNVEIDSGTPLTDAQFTAIAESLKVTG